MENQPPLFCIFSPSSDPAFNLAAEEYLFRNYRNKVFFLYINATSVIVGKHQNSLAEVDPWFLHEKQIPLFRRLSGGGCVYHDLGNLNFSFHQTVDDPARVSYAHFNQPVIDVLRDWGIHAENNSRNDIIVDGKKVSGHARHVFRNRIMSHGTLLVNARRDFLSRALQITPGRYTGKAIPSVRSETANLVDFGTRPIEINELVKQLCDNRIRLENGVPHELTQAERQKIETLAREKYATWEWNYGYSPDYTFQKEEEIDTDRKLSVLLHVAKGTIQAAEMHCTGTALPGLETFRKALPGTRHEMETLEKRVASFFPRHEWAERIVRCLF